MPALFLGPQLHPDAPIGKHLLGRSDPLRPLSQTQAPSAELPTHPAPHGGCQNPSLPHFCSHFSALCSPASAHGSSSRGSPRPPHAGGSAQLPRGDGASLGGCLPAVNPRPAPFAGSRRTDRQAPPPRPAWQNEIPTQRRGRLGRSGLCQWGLHPCSPMLVVGAGGRRGGSPNPILQRREGNPRPLSGLFSPLGVRGRGGLLVF